METTFMLNVQETGQAFPLPASIGASDDLIKRSLASVIPYIDTAKLERAEKDGVTTITVTKNEILYSLNKPDDFILAIVEFRPDQPHRTHYVRKPFQREPDFGVTSVNYDLAELLAKAEVPR